MATSSGRIAYRTTLQRCIKYSSLKYKYKYKYPSLKYEYKYKYLSFKYKYKYKYFVCTASTH